VIYTARDLTSDLQFPCDVAVIGSGAGGAVLAAGLAQRGLRVVIVEEGGYHTSDEFRKLDEAWSMPNLYQERGGRATADQSITVLQGRSVGGGTTVNWTTCYRTPERILRHWQQIHGVDTLTTEALAPHWDAVEDRLGIARWDQIPPNPNNDALLRGASALGWQADRTARNVRNCHNSGYCGFGCPFDAKQAMHLTYVQDALDAGATLFADTRATALELDARGRVAVVHAVVMDPGRDRPSAVKVTIRPDRVALCGGAINSPALLLRSGLTQGPVGRWTWLHPVIAVSGVYPTRIDGWYGAPQSVASHEHVDRGPGEVGMFLEAAPVHPMLAGSTLPGFGATKTAVMGQLAYSSSLLAIHVDGLLPEEQGGTVTLRPDGRVRLDYDVGPALVRAFPLSHEHLARVHFAAGAERVATLHAEPIELASADEVGRLGSARYGAHEHGIFSAHQMGGCRMGPDPETSVVDTHLRHHAVPNLFVVDGSVLPTGLGVNPSETIYGIAHWAVDRVSTG
jgi:choline dehydrogenase-like flavoprotein